MQGLTPSMLNDQTIALDSGFYTLREAGRLLRLNPRMLGRWLRKEEGKPPLIMTDFERINNIYVISFLDLMELRFISYFRKIGIPLQIIREAAKILREESGERHPFIAKGNLFYTDGKRIFLHAAKEFNDEKTIDIVNRQYLMYEVIKGSLLNGVVFDPKTSLPNKWYPDKKNFPDIFVSPYYAFGQPVIEGVPTATLMRNFQAEGVVERVADWYEVSVYAVKEAIRFEVEWGSENLH